MASRRMIVHWGQIRCAPMAAVNTSSKRVVLAGAGTSASLPETVHQVSASKAPMLLANRQPAAAMRKVGRESDSTPALLCHRRHGGQPA